MSLNTNERCQPPSTEGVLAALRHLFAPRTAKSPGYRDKHVLALRLDDSIPPITLPLATILLGHFKAPSTSMR